jgi:chromosome segregation ATPase
MIDELLKDKKNLEDVLKSIQEDGTVEHNNAIKLREENVHLKEEIDNYKKGHRNWADIYHEKIATIDDLVKKNTELKNELSLVEIEQEAILAANHNMAQTLKEKNDRVTLLENALDKWSTKAKSWEKLDEELKSNISELTKEVLNLRHLKTENVELMERLQKKGVSFSEAALQIIRNDYKKCTEQRDEYKHQLNAANKELEVLKSKLRDYQDKCAESFSYNDMNGLQKEIDDLKLMYKERESKLKTYNTSLLSRINFEKKIVSKLDLQVTALHKIIEGAKNTIDEQKAEIKKLQDDIVDYIFEKTEEAKKEANQVVETLRNIKAQGFEDYDPSDFEEQKHPMYPIHWGGYDKNIKEFVESELNNEDPVDGISELLQKAKVLTEGVEVDLDKSLDEQSNESIKRFVESISCPENGDNEISYICDKCGYKIVNDIFYYGDCGFCKEGRMVEYNKWCTTKVAMQDAVQAKQREVYGVESIDWNNLPKTFPNEFQDEETTAENLEEKFDRGEDVIDYFEKPWQCPCNMCKHAREENTEKSWEETASDLALKVAKLEKKVEELIIIKHTSDPNYKYFLEHGYWPYDKEAK